MSATGGNYWARRQMTRRRFGAYAAAGGAGVAGLAIAGCGDDDDDSGGSTPAASATTAPGSSPSAGATAAGQPKKGGEVTFSLGAPTSQTLAPHKTLNLAYFYTPMFLNRLVTPERQKINPLQGELAQSWEQVDKTTYTMKVRPGVTWHEGKIGGGRALNAEDLAFNIMRPAGKTDPQRAALYGRATNFYGLDKAEVVDASTIRVTFSTPNSAFLAGLADWRNWAIAKEHIDKDPDFKDIKNVAGTGPFMIDGWDDASLAGKYVPNPKYWKQGQPYLASVQQVSMPDTAATQAAFFSGKIDFLATISREVREQVQKDRSEAKIYNYDNLQWDYFGMNQNKAPFTDARVRQALYKAIDYTALLDQEFGKDFWSYTTVLVSGLPGAPSATDAGKMSPYNPATKQQDIADAKKLMEQAGFASGNISFKITPSGPAGGGYNHTVRMQDQLKKIWPDMKVEVALPADGAAFARSLGSGDYDVIVYTAAPPPDAIFDIAQRYRTGGSRNGTKFSDPRMDAAVDAVFAEFDEAARAKKLEELAKLVTDNILYAPIGKNKQSTAGQKRVMGFDGYSGPGSFLYPYDPICAVDQLWIA